MDRALDFTDRYWKWIVVGAWLAFCLYFLIDRWNSIHYFVLADTDDNMRMSQVRALLAGQDWFDLRQYKLNPPYGANIHWSRLVDLPIAGIILALRPLVGGVDAERVAIAIAPMLPLLLLLFSLALTVRRLVDRRAYPLVVRRLVLRRLGDGNVRAGADRSPRLAARIALARGRRDRGPEARSRRRRHRHGLGDVAVRSASKC